jgi:uncharacterized membrane protein YfcA
MEPFISRVIFKQFFAEVIKVVMISIYFILFFTSVLGSAINAVAGGGSFFTFPALLLAGVPIVKANATSTVALWPGSVSSSITYRKQLNIETGKLVLFSVVSIVGSVVGTWLLLVTPSNLLQHLLPYLMLTATLLLMSKQKIANGKISGKIASNPVILVIFQFVVAVYGGYFGGGIGILMLAAFNLMGFKDLVQMNALKTLLAALINGAAVILFIITRQVVWNLALVMVAGGLIGGYLGAFLGKRVPPVFLNRFIIATGLFFTVWFFIHQ